MHNAHPCLWAKSNQQWSAKPFYSACKNISSIMKNSYRMYSSISHIFCTKKCPKKSGATYTRGVTCTCTLPLCACYVDGTLHFHVCACTLLLCACYLDQRFSNFFVLQPHFIKSFFMQLLDR